MRKNSRTSGCSALTARYWRISGVCCERSGLLINGGSQRSGKGWAQSRARRQVLPRSGAGNRALFCRSSTRPAGCRLDSDAVASAYDTRHRCQARSVEVFLLALDLIGTFVFAISGATIGVRHRLDLFGVLVLAFATATFGGIARDVVIGALPPAALVNWNYLALSCLAGLVTFRWHAQVERLRNPVQLFDAAGLALFAVYGTEKALAYGLAPFGAVLLGMLSGIGGGIVRDMLVNRTPVVLQAE